MFRRKDVLPLVFLLLVIVTIMITLSQILVVHNKHHAMQPDTRDLEKFKVMLIQLERHINSMLRKDVLPLNKYRKVFAAEIYAERINALLEREEMNASNKRRRKDDVDGPNEFGDGNNYQKRSKRSRTRKENVRLSWKTVDTMSRDKGESYQKLEKAKGRSFLRNNATVTNQNRGVLHTKLYRKGNKVSRTINGTTITHKKQRISHEKLYQKGNKRSRTKNETLRRFGETSNFIKQAGTVNVYSNTAPELKTSRSLLIQLKGNEGGVTNESRDIDGRVDVFPPSLTGDQSVIHGLTASRDQTNRFPGSVRHDVHRVTHCPEYPPDIVGRMRVVPSLNVSLTKFKDHTDIQPGGWWTPPCLARHKVAIIIPYRDRQHHLFTLLFYLIPVLKRQLVEFRIFVVEQKGNHTFNKGIIMNAAFKEAVRLSEYHCYIFHDVDLIPEDDRNLYTCPGLPRHLSVAVDKFGYRLPYSRLVGGVFAIRRADFEMVNGYSNLYWGWGAEDDDMSIRLGIAGLPIERPSATVARYKMLKHKGRVHAPGKWIDYLLKTVKKRFYNDGLSTVNYNVTFVHLDRLFTHVMVDIGQPPTIVGNISAIIR